MSCEQQPDIELEEHGRKVMEAIFYLLGNKWSINIIGLLIRSPKRFSEMQKYLYISPRALTDTLRLLEKYHIISRSVYPTVPVTVEYKLTEAGLTFVDQVVLPINEWWDEYGNEDILKDETMLQSKLKRNS